MRRSKAERLVVATIGAWWLRNVLIPANAVHYSRAARRDERNGFYYTAAMEWRHAAELFAPSTIVAEYCWRQWERIIHLPRRLAGSANGSQITGFPLDQLQQCPLETSEIPLT